MTSMVRIRGWGVESPPAGCGVLTVLDPDTGRYLAAPVDEKFLGDAYPVEVVYARLERELRHLRTCTCRHPVAGGNRLP